MSTILVQMRLVGTKFFLGGLRDAYVERPCPEIVCQVSLIYNSRERGAGDKISGLALRLAFPLMVFSAVAPWVLSQSLFLVRFDGFDASDVVDEQYRLGHFGYFSVGIVAVLAVLVVMAVGIALTIWIGALGGQMGGGRQPGSNNALVSAVRHPLAGEGERIRFEKVGRGEIRN